MFLCKGMGLGSRPALRRMATAGDTDLGAGLLFEERGGEGCRLVIGCSGLRLGLLGTIESADHGGKVAACEMGQTRPAATSDASTDHTFSEDEGVYIDCQTSPGILKGQKDGQAARVAHERDKDGM